MRPVINSYLKRFKLSRRETEATVWLAHGLRAKEIAYHMACSEKTVYAHLARVCKKTGHRDQHEVVCTLLAFACQAPDAPEHPAVGGRFYSRPFDGDGDRAALLRDGR